MPRNSTSIVLPPGNVGSVSIDPATEVIGTVTNQSDTTNFVIAAGKLRVDVTNRGAENGGTPTIATVNGIDLPIGQTSSFYAVHNSATNSFVTTPIITIVTNGAYVFATIYEQ